MVRRALLNLCIRNQDDHTKNIAFLMDHNGLWSLAPAFDVVYAYTPTGDWTNQHQMSLNNKTDNFTIRDLLAFGNFAELKERETKTLINEIGEALDHWFEFCDKAGVPEAMAEKAQNGFRHFKYM